MNFKVKTILTFTEINGHERRIASGKGNGGQCCINTRFDKAHNFVFDGNTKQMSCRKYTHNSDEKNK